MADNSGTHVAPKVPKEASHEVANGEKPTIYWLLPVITALVLVAGFCTYYFVYVGARREYLANRNFRALAVLGIQLQKMISIHGSILEFYADLADSKRHPAHQRTKENLTQFLVVRPEDKNLPPKAQEEEAQRDYLKYLAPTFELIPIEKQATTPKPESRLQVQRRDGSWELVLSARHDEKKAAYYRGSLQLDHLLQPLVGSLPFDDILLVSEEGTIVYQNKKAGPQFTTLTGILQAQMGGAESRPASNPAGAAQSPEARAKPVSGAQDHTGPIQAPISQNADPSWRARSMHLTDIVLAGTRYKLFLQPVLLDTFSDLPDQDEAAHEWVLCGLRSSAALEWEALSISYTFIIWFTALFFAIWMSGPVLKIIFMNRRERLRLRELAFLGLFLVLLTSVLTLSGLQAVHFPLTDDTNEQLNRLGDSLSSNIHDELKAMRDQLKAWCGLKDFLRDDLRTVARKNKEVIRAAQAEDGPRKPKTIQATPGATEYPYVNNAFWTDDDGHQVVKWSTSEYVTPMIEVSKLPLYTHLKTTYLDGKGPPFHFDSVLPPNRLEYLAALTMTTCDCNPRLCDSHNAADAKIREDITGGSAFITAQPLSLIDPVLPFGYGFALIDETGAVLFHVDKARNMRENFRQESDWNKELYAATFGHSTERSLTIRYLGKDYQARVIPIRDVSPAPWSLIVYRDQTSVRTLDLQAMTMAATCLLWLLAAPAVILAISCAIQRPRFAPEWVWPNQRRMGTYVYQIYLYTLLIILFLFLGFHGPSEQIVIACVAVPYTALLLTWWCFRLYPQSGEEPHGRTASRLLAAPATLSMLGAIVFALALVFQWAHLKALILLLGTGIIAAVPLLYKPRHYLIGRLNHWCPGDAVAEQIPSRPEPGLFTYRNCYVLSVLLLLLLTGVLTPMALFRASLSVEQRLGIKQSQLRLASALAQRRMLLQDQCDKGELGEAACANFKDDHSGVWRQIALDPRFAANGEPLFGPHKPAAQHEEPYSGWFRRLIYLLHHDYNETAAETLGVIPDRIHPQPGRGFPEWSWEDKGSTIALRWHGVHPPDQQDQSAEHDLLITSAVPASSPRAAFACAGIAAAVMLVIGGLFWALARKVFFFHVAPLKMTGARQVAESIREGRNILILLPPVSDWQLEVPKWTVDLTVVATQPKWAEIVDVDTVPRNSVIEIRHFEYGENNPEIDNQKAVLFQRLREKGNAQVAAVMTVPASSKDYRRMFPDLEVIDLREEPFPWLKQYEGPARDLIWKECSPMAALWPIGAQLAKDIKAEATQSEDTIASEILERADAYYRLVWKECSKEQKFVLAQLAEDGLLNPTNGRPIRQLLRRGLLARDPQFRIMNESFRRFLRSATTAELKQDWLRESRRSGWGKVHGAFFTTIALLGVFLLTTQNALWESAAAYVTTALGALGTLTKLFNTFRGGGTTEKAT